MKLSPTYKINVLDSVISFITENYNNNCQKIINELALAQRELVQTKAGFRYKKDVYRHELETAPKYQFKLLHQELLPKFETYLDQWSTFDARLEACKAMLITALNLVKSTKDIFLLLPECLHSVLPQATEHTTLTTTQVETFHNQFKQEIQQIKVALLINSIK